MRLEPWPMECLAILRDVPLRGTPQDEAEESLGMTATVIAHLLRLSRR